MKQSPQDPGVTSNPLVSKAKGANKSLLLMIVLTLVNVFLVLVDAPISFLFSAAVPMYIISIGMEAGGLGAPIALILAGAVVGVYAVCYFAARKKSWGFLVAAILFCVDTVILIAIGIMAFDFWLIADLAFHAWVLVSLFGGFSAARKLKHMPPMPAPVYSALPAGSASCTAGMPPQPPAQEPAAQPESSPFPGSDTQDPGQAP